MLHLVLLSLFAFQDRKPAPPAPPGVPPAEEAVTVLRGHVVEEGTDAPVAGYPVRLWGGGIEPVEVVSDEAGDFALPRPVIERGELSVAAQPSPGWRAVERRVSVGAGVEELLLVVRRVETTPFRARITDERGRVVPYARVKVYDGSGASESCEADADGLLTPATPFVVGWMEVSVSERSAGVSSWSHVRVQHRGEAEAPPVECRLRFGRTTELDVLGLGPFAPGSASGYTVVRLRAGEEPAAFAWPRPELAEVRTDGPAGARGWFRFVLPRGGSRAGETWLREDDGLAVARLREEPGRAGFTGELRPTGAVLFTAALSASLPEVTVTRLGRTHTCAAAASEASLALELTPVGLIGERRPFRRTVFGPAREDRLGWLAPGRWHVDVSSPYFPPCSGEVDVVAGEQARLVVSLPPPLDVRPLVIVYADPSRDIPERHRRGDWPELRVWVQPADPAGRSYTAVTSSFCASGIDAFFERVRRDGRWVLQARLEQVPPGTYSLALRVAGRVEEEQDARPGDVVLFEAAAR